MGSVILGQAAAGTCLPADPPLPFVTSPNMGSPTAETAAMASLTFSPQLGGRPHTAGTPGCSCSLSHAAHGRMQYSSICTSSTCARKCGSTATANCRTQRPVGRVHAALHHAMSCHALPGASTVWGQQQDAARGQHHHLYVDHKRAVRRREEVHVERMSKSMQRQVGKEVQQQAQGAPAKPAACCRDRLPPASIPHYCTSSAHCTKNVAANLWECLLAGPGPSQHRGTTACLCRLHEPAQV